MNGGKGWSDASCGESASEGAGVGRRPGGDVGDGDRKVERDGERWISGKVWGSGDDVGEGDAPPISLTVVGVDGAEELDITCVGINAG